MKLDELEKECGGKADPIADSCRRPTNPFVPINPTVPNPQALQAISSRNPTEDRGLCKITRYTPDPTVPGGFREQVEWIDTNKLPTMRTKKYDSHLGGVESDKHISDGIEQDIAALRYAYPYSEEFGPEDWAGIN